MPVLTQNGSSVICHPVKLSVICKVGLKVSRRLRSDPSTYKQATHQGTFENKQNFWTKITQLCSKVVPQEHMVH